MILRDLEGICNSMLEKSARVALAQSLREGQATSEVRIRPVDYNPSAYRFDSLFHGILIAEARTGKIQGEVECDSGVLRL